MTLSRMVNAQAPAIPDVDETRRAVGRELSCPIYHDYHDLWNRIWSWLKRLSDVGSMVPGVPSWVSMLVMVPTVAADIALLTLLLIRLFSACRVATPPSLSVFIGDRDTDALTHTTDTAAAQVDLTTATIGRFRVIIRSLDERGVINEYLGMTALETATPTHQALNEHRVVAPLYEAAHLFDVVLYGRMVSTGAQDQQMYELADQMTAIRLPGGRTLADASVCVPGIPA